jgi:hypothetical protein
MSVKTPKKWTVMVYLAGDNNLDEAGVADLKEMKKVGSTEDVNVIAQFDRQGRDQATKRYSLTKTAALERDMVARLGETNTGDPDVLANFLLWGFKDFPAEHYLVVVWNHGNGWNDEDVYGVARGDLRYNLARRGTILKRAKAAGESSVSVRRVRVIAGQNFHRSLFRTSIQSAIRTRGIAYDDSAQDFLDNKEMKSVLSSAARKIGRKIDILGMDACLMSMAEVGYQLRDGVALTVGSEETEPGDGWPYDRILGALTKNPKMKPEALAGRIVKDYMASYKSNAGVTLSAFDLAKSGEMAGAVNELSKVLLNNLSDSSVRTAVLLSRKDVQAYEVPDYIDLCDFCDLLEKQCSVAEIQEACRKVKSAGGKGAFIVSAGYKGAKVAHSHGVSIYFPAKKLSLLYKTLDFAKATTWLAFLEAYLQSTRRPG